MFSLKSLKTVNLIILVSSLVAVSATLVSGQSGSLDTILSSYRVYNLPDLQMQKIASQFEVTRRLNDKVNIGFEVIVPVSQKRKFLELAPEALLVERDISQKVLSARFLNQGPAGLGYRNFDSVLQHLAELVQKYPDLAQIEEYGQTAEGRPLVALKVSDQVSKNENEPELMLTAATHGDEIITTEVLVHLIDELLAQYSLSSRVAEILNNKVIYFIPVVNPDGFVRLQRYENMADPNRSYPYPEKPNVKPTPSISALIQFFNAKNIVGSIDFHAYGEMVMYPWAYTYNSVDAKDEAVFHPIAEKMAETNSYAYGPISKVIYVAKGSSADYYYWQKKTIAMAIEIGQMKAPPASQIPAYIDSQREATYRFLESF